MKETHQMYEGHPSKISRKHINPLQETQHIPQGKSRRKPMKYLKQTNEISQEKQ